MTGIVFTSTPKCILAVNNDYSGITGALGTIHKKANFQKDDIFRIALSPDESFVEVQFKSREAVYFVLSFNGSVGTLKVETVDGVAPISNSDLYDKLIALLG